MGNNGIKRTAEHGWTHCGMSHAEIAAALGISRQRVEQLEKRALRKLRRGLERMFNSEDLADLKRSVGCTGIKLKTKAVNYAETCHDLER